MKENKPTRCISLVREVGSISWTRYKGTPKCTAYPTSIKAWQVDMSGHASILKFVFEVGSVDMVALVITQQDHEVIVAVYNRQCNQ